jgi:hypothetical protein
MTAIETPPGGGSVKLVWRLTDILVWGNDRRILGCAPVPLTRPLSVTCG